MKTRSSNFKANVAEALHDGQLQKALKNVPDGFVAKRAKARSKLPEFDALTLEARQIKAHTLEHLDLYLENFERQVIAQGGNVHWARSGVDACDIIGDICRSNDARIVAKSKSMVTEEIALNSHLERMGLEVVETDLGEYIIQIRGETPSHIIAPAIHLTKEQIVDDFRRVHNELETDRALESPETLVAEAREVLRAKFLAADVGITGANLLVAETGASVIVTNEGNADLVQTLPRVHIVVASIEKMVPTIEDATTILRVLARSATGQELSTYTTFTNGPRRAGDMDGPVETHVILLDNGRTELLASEFHEVLRCIRCGACMNHCPVYQAVGGHSYGWVYPGPIGAVLTPSHVGIEEAYHLPFASSFCGACEAVCPMGIPLPKLMRQWRNRAFKKELTSRGQAKLLKGWLWLAMRPRTYHRLTSWGMRAFSFALRRPALAKWLPLPADWTKHREFPVPDGMSFQARFKNGGHRLTHTRRHADKKGGR